MNLSLISINSLLGALIVLICLHGAFGAPTNDDQSVIGEEVSSQLSLPLTIDAEQTKSSDNHHFIVKRSGHSGIVLPGTFFFQRKSK